GITGLNFSRESAQLVIYPRKGRDALLAWHVRFSTELQGSLPPGRWNYFIDAKTGDIVDHFNALDTLEQASGPGGNPKVARHWDGELDVEPTGAGDYMMQT